MRVFVASANEHLMVAQLLMDHGRVVLERNLNLGWTQHYGGAQPRIFLDGWFEKWEGTKGGLIRSSFVFGRYALLV